MTEAIVAIIGALLGAITTLMKTFRFVKEGEKGCILRFGKLNRVRDPGFIVTIPWVETLETIHVRETTTELHPQTITLKDNYIIKVSAVLVYKVIDPVKALYNISKVHEAVVDIAMTVLRHEFAKQTWDEVQDFEKINEELLKDLKELTQNWGIEFLHFRVSSLEPTEETTELLLLVAKAEKQIEANNKLLDDLFRNKEKIVGESGGPIPSIAYAAWFRNSSMPTVTT